MTDLSPPRQHNTADGTTSATAAAALLLRQEWSRETRAMVPEQFGLKFRDVRARPTVLQVYHPCRGWDSSIKKTRMTFGIVAELMDAGVTMIDVKWKSQHFQFSLSSLTPAPF